MQKNEERNLRHAFVASTPFTLMEAIHFTLINELDADVYITKSYNDAENVAERLKRADVFRNVHVTENVLLEYPITIKQCIKTVINGKKIVKELRNRKYEYGYYNNSGWLINSIFYTGFMKGNKDCKQRFIEHGYNTLLNDYADKSWKLRLMIYLFGFKCMDGSMLEALYVFEPKLLHVRHDGELRVMPKMDITNDKFRNAINIAFKYEPEKNEFISKNIIIMEEGPQKVKFDKDKFWGDILNILNTSEAIIKPHPRLKNSTLRKYNIPIYENNSMPWEVFMMNMNMDNKIQFAMFSGSCIMPKYVFGIDAQVVLLYKLLPVDYEFMGKEILALTNEIKELYEDPARIFIPENLDELKSYLVDKNLLANQ